MAPRWTGKRIVALQASPSHHRGGGSSLSEMSILMIRGLSLA